MTVDIFSSGHGTEWFAPNQPVEYRNKVVGNTVFTNPLNGKLRGCQRSYARSTAAC
jgi:hypothetical protein